MHSPSKMATIVDQWVRTSAISISERCHCRNGDDNDIRPFLGSKVKGTSTWIFVFVGHGGLRKQEASATQAFLYEMDVTRLPSSGNVVFGRVQDLAFLDCAQLSMDWILIWAKGEDGGYERGQAVELNGDARSEGRAMHCLSAS